MAMIYVKTKPGRRAYYEGKIIPNDKFIPVTDDPYIRRLVEHWGDLEVEGGRGRERSKGEAQDKRKQDVRPSSARPASPTQADPNTPAQGTGAPRPQN